MSKYIISILVWLVGIVGTAFLIVFFLLPIITPEPGTSRTVVNIILGFVQGLFWYGFARYFVFEKLAERELRAIRRSNYRY